MGCSVSKNLEIVAGTLEDYGRLSRFHYRDTKLGPYAAIFALRYKQEVMRRVGVKTVGVIVYTMPSVGLELRNVATGGYYCGFDKATRTALINRDIRCISRVIIEPRFRGLGLASRLVKETMERMDVAIIEAMAVMGEVNPFFERAGMTAFRGGRPGRCVQMIEALNMVGIDEMDLIDGEKVQGKIEGLPSKEADFIEGQMRCFLKSYGKRRDMAAGLSRTRYVLSKLTERPVYYIWFKKRTAGSI